MMLDIVDFFDELFELKSRKKQAATGETLADNLAGELPAVIPLAPDSDWSVWEDAIPTPGPCPKCGNLELWWDMLGRQRCQRCEQAIFERALRLAEQAKSLWRRG
jgi:hypothetical protein